MLPLLQYHLLPTERSYGSVGRCPSIWTASFARKLLLISCFPDMARVVGGARGLQSQ